MSPVPLEHHPPPRYGKRWAAQRAGEDRRDDRRRARGLRV